MLLGCDGERILRMHSELSEETPALQCIASKHDAFSGQFAQTGTLCMWLYYDSYTFLESTHTMG